MTSSPQANFHSVTPYSSLVNKITYSIPPAETRSTLNSAQSLGSLHEVTTTALAPCVHHSSNKDRENLHISSRKGLNSWKELGMLQGQLRGCHSSVKVTPSWQHSSGGQGMLWEPLPVTRLASSHANARSSYDKTHISPSQKRSRDHLLPFQAFKSHIPNLAEIDLNLQPEIQICGKNFF